MNSTLNGKNIALLATNGFEDSELTQPMEAATNAGANVTVISLDTNDIEGKNGTPINVEKAIGDVSIDNYDGLILPGGQVNPDTLRISEPSITFIRAFFSAHKPVAAICHAPWLLIEAEVVEGRTVTSWPSLRKDLENAGANWVDKEVVVDNGLVTSRNPDDLPAFCEKMIEAFNEGKHEGQVG